MFNISFIQHSWINGYLYANILYIYIYNNKRMRLGHPTPQVLNMLEHTSVEKFVSPRKI